MRRTVLPAAGAAAAIVVALLLYEPRRAYPVPQTADDAATASDLAQAVASAASSRASEQRDTAVAPMSAETAPAPPLEDGALAVTGRVVDDALAPVAGVAVRLECPRMPSSQRTARTDAAGRFAMRVPALFGEAWITAEAPGYAPAAISTVARDPRALDLGALVLRRPARLHGAVVTAEGAEAPGAMILFEQTSPYGSTERRAIATIAADEHGRFNYPAPIGPLTITARLGDGASATVRVRARSDNDQPLLLQLPAQRRLTGRVVDQDGAPIADARVDPRLPYDGSTRSGPETLTGDDGIFTLWADAAHAPWLAISKAGYLEASPGYSSGVADNDTYTLRKLRLAEIVSVGRDGRPGAALKRVVRLKPDVRLFDGTRAASAPSRQRWLVPRGEGREASLFECWSERGDRRLVAVPESAAEIERVDVDFDDGVAVEGAIVDDQNNPAAGATARIAERREHADAYNAPDRYAVADAHGRFRFENMHASSFTLSAFGPAGASAETILQIETRSPPPAALVLHATGGITGRVIRDGKPVVGEAIGAYLPVPAHAILTSVTFAFTDAAGRFRIVGLPPAAYRLQANDAWNAGPTSLVVVQALVRGEHESLASADVRVDAGKMSDVEMRLPDTPFHVRVRVADGARPGAGALVRWHAAEVPDVDNGGEADATGEVDAYPQPGTPIEFTVELRGASKKRTVRGAPGESATLDFRFGAADK